MANHTANQIAKNQTTNVINNPGRLRLPHNPIPPMKARHIRKLRKQLQSYHTYRVIECYGTFGDFHISYESYYDHMVKAANALHAIQRYNRYYWRHYKQKCSNSCNWYTETTSKFGTFLVIDERGYKRFFH